MAVELPSDSIVIYRRGLDDLIRKSGNRKIAVAPLVTPGMTPVQFTQKAVDYIFKRLASPASVKEIVMEGKLEHLGTFESWHNTRFLLFREIYLREGYTERFQELAELTVQCMWNVQIASDQTKMPPGFVARPDISATTESLKRVTLLLGSAMIDDTPAANKDHIRRCWGEYVQVVLDVAYGNEPGKLDIEEYIVARTPLTEGQLLSKMENMRTAVASQPVLDATRVKAVTAAYVDDMERIGVAMSSGIRRHSDPMYYDTPESPPLSAKSGSTGASVDVHIRDIDVGGNYNDSGSDSHSEASSHGSRADSPALSEENILIPELQARAGSGVGESAIPCHIQAALSVADDAILVPTKVQAKAETAPEPIALAETSGCNGAPGQVPDDVFDITLIHNILADSRFNTDAELVAMLKELEVQLQL